MREIVKVTQSDIDNSIHSMWTEANPLSIAMLDQWGSYHVVDLSKGVIVNTEIGRVFRLSKEAIDLVTKFQAKEAVSPCEVEVEFVEQNFYTQFSKDHQ